MLKQPSQCGKQGQRWRWPCTMDALSQILWSMPSICLDMSFFHVQHVQSKLFTDYFNCRLVVMLLPHTAASHQKRSGPKRRNCYPQRPSKLDVRGSNKIKYFRKFLNMQSWIKGSMCCSYLQEFLNQTAKWIHGNPSKCHCPARSR